jgi:hypothetical protein
MCSWSVHTSDPSAFGDVGLYFIHTSIALASRAFGSARGCENAPRRSASTGILRKAGRTVLTRPWVSPG